jgi:hypothetical protein
MAEIALITKADIQGYRYISEQMQDERLAAYIQEVQRFKLRELLGREMYYDLFQNVTDINTIAAPYI